MYFLYHFTEAKIFLKICTEVLLMNSSSNRLLSKKEFNKSNEFKTLLFAQLKEKMNENIQSKENYNKNLEKFHQIVEEKSNQKSENQKTLKRPTKSNSFKELYQIQPIEKPRSFINPIRLKSVSNLSNHIEIQERLKEIIIHGCDKSKEDIGRINELLEKGANPIECLYGESKTPIEQAMLLGKIEFVKCLFKRTKDVSIKSKILKRLKEVNIYLIESVNNKSLKDVELALKLGGNPDTRFLITRDDLDNEKESLEQENEVMDNSYKNTPLGEAYRNLKIDKNNVTVRIFNALYSASKDHEYKKIIAHRLLVRK
jgi:hypothetical protein